MSNKRRLSRVKAPASSLVQVQLRLTKADRRTRRANRRTLPLAAFIPDYAAMAEQGAQLDIEAVRENNR
jgi:hypothetical protein